MKVTLLTITLISLVLVACTVGPTYDSPIIEMPCEWQYDDFEEIEDDEILWWQSFNDPLLDSLIERAVLHNLDLGIAATRILEARVEEKGGRFNLYPRLDGSATYGYVNYNKKTLNRILGCCEPRSKQASVNFFEIGFDAEWELDLFGKNLHDLNALRAKTESSEYEYMNLWVTLSAEVAKNYIELRGLQNRLELIKRHIESQEDLFHLTQSLIQSGFSSTLDQMQKEEHLNRLRAQKAPIELSISKSIHRLSILLGYNPEMLFVELCAPQPLPDLPCRKRIGVPSELLRRRPDILQSERELAAASEQVGSAIAALFPRISLQGFVGDLVTLGSGSFIGFGGCQILQPIFNSKLLEKDVTMNQLKAREALLVYQKTVLAALEETENAIASFHFELERNTHLAKALDASLEARTLMIQLYEKGLKDYIEVQLANLTLLESEDTYLQSQVDLLIDYIALYKALGGSWEACLAE